MKVEQDNQRKTELGKDGSAQETSIPDNKSGREGRYYIVHEEILPEAIWKTAKVKDALAHNHRMTVNEAVEQIGISRSAFYKYKDGVFPFYEATRHRIITIQIHMENVAGLLSCCMDYIARANGNILTINQGIPIHDVAIATIAFETAEISQDLESLIVELRKIYGVISVEIIGQN